MIFGRDEPPDQHDLLGFDCPAIHDFPIDFCVEDVVITPTDYPFVTSQWSRDFVDPAFSHDAFSFDGETCFYLFVKIDFFL